MWIFFINGHFCTSPIFYLSVSILPIFCRIAFIWVIFKLSIQHIDEKVVLLPQGFHDGTSRWSHDRSIFNSLTKVAICLSNNAIIWVGFRIDCQPSNYWTDIDTKIVYFSLLKVTNEKRHSKPTKIKVCEWKELFKLQLAKVLLCTYLQYSKNLSNLLCFIILKVFARYLKWRSEPEKIQTRNITKIWKH